MGDYIITDDETMINPSTGKYLIFEELE